MAKPFKAPENAMKITLKNKRLQQSNEPSASLTN